MSKTIKELLTEKIAVPTNTPASVFVPSATPAPARPNRPGVNYFESGEGSMRAVGLTAAAQGEFAFHESKGSGSFSNEATYYGDLDTIYNASSATPAGVLASLTTPVGKNLDGTVYTSMKNLMRFSKTFPYVTFTGWASRQTALGGLGSE